MRRCTKKKKKTLHQVIIITFVIKVRHQTIKSNKKVLVAALQKWREMQVRSVQDPARRNYVGQGEGGNRREETLLGTKAFAGSQQRPLVTFSSIFIFFYFFAQFQHALPLCTVLSLLFSTYTCTFFQSTLLISLLRSLSPYTLQNLPVYSFTHILSHTDFAPHFLGPSNTYPSNPARTL